MAASSGKFVGLIKQGWNEIPEVMVSGVLALIGLTISAGCMYKYSKLEMQNRKYKLYPVYMRPDNPRVPKIHMYDDEDCLNY